MSIYERVISLCSQFNTDKTSVERACGFSQNSINKWQKSAPSIDKIIKVADYFGVTTDYLLGRDYTITSYQVFVEICAKEGKSIFEVAKEFGLVEEQIIQWKNGVEPSQRTLWAIANTFHYRENPFDKAKEKKSVIGQSELIERPDYSISNDFAVNYEDIIKERAFNDLAKLYKAVDSSMRAQMLVVIATYLNRSGIDTVSIVGY